MSLVIGGVWFFRWVRLGIGVVVVLFCFVCLFWCGVFCVSFLGTFGLVWWFVSSETKTFSLP